MIRCFKTLVLILGFSLLGVGTFGIVTASAATSTPIPGFADVNSLKGNACAGLSQVEGTTCDDSKGENGINKIVKAAVNILSLVVGMAAAIMIIVSGMKYITSGGDAQKVSSAKTTLVYALIGIAVAALAQFLVHFVLFQTKQPDATGELPSIIKLKLDA
jgi:uncharacterized membrane protein YuzA (DUF378 family)